MEFSHFKRRSIADQTGNIDFRFNLVFNNTTGECVVGLSGTRVFKFSCKSGKIYDDIGNFVQSYEPRTQVRISGQLGQTSYDYAINDELIALGNPTSSGKYSWLFIEPKNGTVDFEGYVQGKTPNYYADNAGKYHFANDIVTGRVINLNPEQKFRIFDIAVDQPSSPYSVLDFTTGDISGTGYILLSSDQLGLNDYIVPLTLKTNFGDVPLNFTVSGDYSVVPDIYLNISPDTTNVLNNVAKNYTIQYACYPTGSSLGISLEYVSGVTGNIYFFQEQVSELQYRLIEGIVTGSRRFSITDTGLVSGQDPKTNIYEIGTGTGDFTSSVVYATGNVESGYSIKAYGRGNGFITTDYTASGWASGLYSGIVPIQGGYLTIVGFNFLGTGDNPGVAVGYVPTGTGRYFARPTGCLAISTNLIYGSDFYSGNIVAQKAYQGPLSIPYSVLAVGYATGARFSGVVDSMFVLNFDQGEYTFSKFYSGLVSGFMQTTGNFEPTGCINDYAMASGIVTGYFSVTRMLDCSQINSLPSIPISGYPVLVYDSNKKLISPSKVVLVRPTAGFAPTETSYDALNGTYTRTKTSRMGSTPSGEGFFQNVVGECSTADTSGKVWKESMTMTSSTSVFDSIGNSLGYVSSRLYMTGTGDMEQSRSQMMDSGVLHFAISGEGKKAVALRGINFGQEDRILKLVLLKNGVFLDSWENVSIQNGLNKYSSVALTNSDYDTIGLSELTSGYYSLYVTARQATPPVVYFAATGFSGCEASRNLVVTVKASGTFRSNVCVDLVDYEEITAHSGVNYDPIYLRYNDSGLRALGCSGIIGSNAKVCPGICFAAGTPNDDGQWEEEVRSYTFTIPIYDNGGYGKDHSFNISLSNPSGATLAYPSEATIRIVENDNPAFVLSDGSTEYRHLTNPIGGEITNVIRCDGFTTGCQEVGLELPANLTTSPVVGLDCSPIDPLPPDPPDPCIFSPWICYPCILNPSLCDKSPDPKPECSGCEPTCCSCSSVMFVTGMCEGYSGIFSGIVGVPGSTCGQVSVEGCGPTDGYIYVGKMCCSGTSITPSFYGPCLSYSFVAYPDDCAQKNGDCVSGECRGNVNWSGCASDAVTCSGDCPPTGSGCSQWSFDDCFDYAAKIPKRGRPKGPKCSSLLVFLKVYPTPNCSTSASSCISWGWSGICKFPNTNPIGQICPPPPPK